MNKRIQLHDCGLSAVTFEDRSTKILLSPAYVHESSGVPGFDSGLAWAQVATLTLSTPIPLAPPVELPTWVLDGTLRIGEVTYETFIPASGCFEGAAELCLRLSTAEGEAGETLTFRAGEITIELSGEPSHVGEFKGYAES